MTDEFERIDVPAGKPGEIFDGELPTIRTGNLIEPGWVALCQLQQAVRDDRISAACGAAMAGAFVRTMRARAGLTQTQLSQESGITQSVISDIERGVGKHGPSFETMIRLATACGMEIGFAPREHVVMPDTHASDSAAEDPLVETRIDPGMLLSDISWLHGYENMRPALIGRGISFFVEKGAYDLAMKTAVALGAPAGRKAVRWLVGAASVPAHNRRQVAPQAPTEMAVDDKGLFTVHRADGSELVLAPIAYRAAGSN